MVQVLRSELLANLRPLVAYELAESCLVYGGLDIAYKTQGFVFCIIMTLTKSWKGLYVHTCYLDNMIRTVLKVVESEVYKFVHSNI